jgi:hypothetical protein
MESGSKQLGHELRLVAFARLTAGAARVGSPHWTRALGRLANPPALSSARWEGARADQPWLRRTFCARRSRSWLALATSSVVNYLVDPASSHMLVSKIKPCMSKYKLLIL